MWEGQEGWHDSNQALWDMMILSSGCSGTPCIYVKYFRIKRLLWLFYLHCHCASTLKKFVKFIRKIYTSWKNILQQSLQEFSPQLAILGGHISYDKATKTMQHNDYNLYCCDSPSLNMFVRVYWQQIPAPLFSHLVLVCWLCGFIICVPSSLIE